MTYFEFKQNIELQNNIVNEIENSFKSFLKGQFGLVSDEDKNSKEYKELKKKFDIEFKKLQEINLYGMKNFKKEQKKERDLKIKLFTK